MNHKAPYEQLIAERLEALPVPDMADAIWVRIEAQLDTDMPAGDADAPLPDGPSGSSIWSQSLLFMTIIAVMSLFTIPKKDIPPTTQSTTDTALPTQLNEPNAQPPPGTANPASRVRQGTVTLPGVVQPSTLDTGLASVSAPPTDSAANGSLLVQQPAPPPVATPILQDSLPRKKPRGVTGIGNSDYRILPKKDSTGN